MEYGFILLGFVLFWLFIGKQARKESKNSVITGVNAVNRNAQIAANTATISSLHFASEHIHDLKKDQEEAGYDLLSINDLEEMASTATKS